MTVATWPTELPLPKADDYSEAKGETRKFSSAEQGPPRVRRRASMVADAVSCFIVVDPNLRARFDRFWEELSEGTDPFTMPDPGRDGLTLMDETGAVLTDEAGNPLVIAETWLCLFGQRVPEHSPVSGRQHWRIAFDLMVMP